MKRKILVIHNGYPLRGDGGDKVRTLNMLQSWILLDLMFVCWLFSRKIFLCWL